MWFRNLNPFHFGLRALAMLTYTNKEIPDCVVPERGRNISPWAVFPPSELTSRCVVEIIIKLCHQLWQRHSRRGSFIVALPACRAGCWCGGGVGGQGAQPVFFDVCPLIAGLPLETRPKVTKVWVEWAMGVALVTSPLLPDGCWRWFCVVSRGSNTSIIAKERADGVCVCVFPTLSLQVAKFEPLSSPFTNIFPFPLPLMSLFLSLPAQSYILYCCGCVPLRARRARNRLFHPHYGEFCLQATHGCCCCYCGIWKGSCHINFERDSLVWEDEFQRGALSIRCQDIANLSACVKNANSYSGQTPIKIFPFINGMFPKQSDEALKIYFHGYAMFPYLKWINTRIFSVHGAKHYV